MYPSPPRSVYRSASPEEKSHFAKMAAPRELPPRAGPELDAELERCLVACELGYLLTRGVGWDQVSERHQRELKSQVVCRWYIHAPATAGSCAESSKGSGVSIWALKSSCADGIYIYQSHIYMHLY